MLLSGIRFLLVDSNHGLSHVVLPQRSGQPFHTLPEAGSAASHCTASV